MEQGASAHTKTPCSFDPNEPNNALKWVEIAPQLKVKTEVLVGQLFALFSANVSVVQDIDFSKQNWIQGKLLDNNLF